MIFKTSVASALRLAWCAVAMDFYCRVCDLPCPEILSDDKAGQAALLLDNLEQKRGSLKSFGPQLPLSGYSLSL